MTAKEKKSRGVGGVVSDKRNCTGTSIFRFFTKNGNKMTRSNKRKARRPLIQTGERRWMRSPTELLGQPPKR